MDNIFICGKCSKEFKYKKSLIYHQNKKIPCDDNNNKYKCNYCNKELSKTTKINKHLKIYQACRYQKLNQMIDNHRF